MDNPEVQTSSGRLKGEILKHVEELPFYSFKGISYAKPPIGYLKFKVRELIKLNLLQFSLSNGLLHEKFSSYDCLHRFVDTSHYNIVCII